MDIKDIGGKSVIRERYETEVSQIKNRFGTLEQMRARLGLTKRRMAEYLLVDPSAWTRWTTEGAPETAPLHVYKTMSFLMSQFERDPKSIQEAHPVDIEAFKRLEFELRREVRDLQREAAADMRQQFAHELSEAKLAMRQEFSREVDLLKKMALGREELSFGWKVVLLLNALVTIYLIFF